MAKEVVKRDEFQLMTAQSLEALKVNAGTSGITPQSLLRVKVPSGGGIMWELPTITDEPEMAKEFEAVCVYFKDGRLYWKDKDAQGVPPDCVSNDNILGKGNPGGICAVCPLNAWGSAVQGKGKACKQIRQMFLMRSGKSLPIVLNAPPTSLAEMQKFFMKLSSENIYYFSVLMSFKLKQEKNPAGTLYSSIVPSVVRKLTDSELAVIKEYGKEFLEVMKQVDVDPGVAQE